MKVARYVRSNAFFTVLILFLVSVIVAISAFSAVKAKNREIEDMNRKVEDMSGQIATDKQTAKEKEQQLLEEKQKLSEEKEQISKELDNANKERDKLKKENKKYKNALEKLSAKEKAEVNKVLAEKDSPQSEYPAANKVCYLTFDDGPSDNTLKILKILKKYDAKATFFVIGTNSKLQYLPQILEQGHAIGLHSNTHIYSKIYKSTDAFFNDINELSKKIEKETGHKTTLLRFPGGSNNSVSESHCIGIMTALTKKVLQKGYSYFDWNVDSGDASGNNVSAAKIKNNVLQQAKNRNSICVLMHDTAVKKTTVDALPGILEGLKKQGYKFEALTPETYGYHFSKLNN